MIAALFVHKGGVYYGIPEIDPWDVERDARFYDGPHPVIAHPPCQRWGSYWHGGPNSEKFPRLRQILGDDQGCFAAALSIVREVGGIIEHPRESRAWKHHGINHPPVSGGWVAADEYGGWTCCVEQGHYGHRARKSTWLYLYGIDPLLLPDLKWGSSGKRLKLDDGYHSSEHRRLAKLNGTHNPGPRLTHKERIATPIVFRDLLIDMVKQIHI